MSTVHLLLISRDNLFIPSHSLPHLSVQPLFPIDHSKPVIRIGIVRANLQRALVARQRLMRLVIE